MTTRRHRRTIESVFPLVLLSPLSVTRLHHNPPHGPTHERRFPTQLRGAPTTLNHLKPQTRTQQTPKSTHSPLNLSSYPFVIHINALAYLSGVLSNPSLSGSSPIHSSTVRIAPDRRARLAAEEEGVEWRRRWVDLAVGRRARGKASNATPRRGRGKWMSVDGRWRRWERSDGKQGRERESGEGSVCDRERGFVEWLFWAMMCRG
jgi:hypothetical protein